MNFFETVRRSVLFLKHLNNEESDYFFRLGRIVSVKSGQYADLKKTNSLNIVLTGIFEVETIGSAEVVYFTSGSFFGSLPFVENRKRGNIRALLDSRIFVIHEEDIYRFFLKYHKALRGYLRMVTAMGFGITDAGKKYFDIRGRVVSVFGMNPGCGKTFLTSLIGLSLAEYDTVLLDLSYSGLSLFDILEQRLTAPVSEKGDGVVAESVINDRLVHVRDKLYMLNITNSSRVKIDSSIIGTVLFLLSRRFRYIIADISNSDHELRDAMLKRSDIVFAFVDSKKDVAELNLFLDKTIDDFQRVFYVRNEYTSHEKGIFVGGLTLEKNSEYGKNRNMDSLEGFINEKKLDPFTEKIIKTEKSLVVQSLALDSVCLSRFFIDLHNEGTFFDCIYSSSLSYFLVSLYLLGGDEKSLAESMKRFYSPELLNRNMEISFPGSFIFKNNRIMKYSHELAGDRRIEMFQSLPACKLQSYTGERIFTTGSLSHIMTACWANSPYFEPAHISGDGYSSGFPNLTVSPAELFRTDFDEIYYISVSNKDTLVTENSINNRFYLQALNPDYYKETEDSSYLQSGKNFVMELSETEFKFDKISDKTKKLSQSLIARIV